MGDAISIVWIWSHFYFQPTRSIKNEIFFVTSLFLIEVRSNLIQGFKIECLFLFLAQKVVFGDDFGQSDHYFTSLIGQRPFRNSATMATLKVPGDLKLFERACYTLIRKFTKFQLLTPNSYWTVLTKLAPPPPPPSKIGSTVLVRITSVQWYAHLAEVFVMHFCMVDILTNFYFFLLFWVQIVCWSSLNKLTRT